MLKKILPINGQMAISDTVKGAAAFSMATRVGDLLFISGQLAVDKDMKIVGKGDMRVQTREVLKYIKYVLDWAGGTPSDITKLTVFVSDISKFREIHDERLQFFEGHDLPASTMVEVSKFVHPDALIEIDAIAVLKAAA
jgi:enamine deaminase RidA (YjgF/YER057c/UK114 family)